MRYADILDDGTSLTAAGWIGPGASDDEQFLSPFRSGADNWVADSRLLPIDRKAPTLGRVVVQGESHSVDAPIVVKRSVAG